MNETTAAFVTRHARRNFILNVTEGGLFMFGMSMVSRFTVLPYFVEQYSKESWVQGIIPTIANVGWLLPGLIVAPMIAHLWRRKPAMLIGTFFERLPWLVVGLWLMAGNTFDSVTTLAIFFSLYGLHMFSAGATSIPWQDFIGRVIPEQRWGTFFGFQSGVGSLLGVAGAAVATKILASEPLVVLDRTLLQGYTFPFNIGVLSLGAFACLFVSYFFLMMTVEPAIEPQEKQPIWGLLKDMPRILREDRVFTTYLVARTGISLGMLGQSFVTAAALAKFQSTGSTVGAFTVTLLAAQAAGNFGLGAISDRFGHKFVLVLSGFLGLVSLALAVVAPSEIWYYPIFVFGGIALGGYQLSGFTMVMSFANTDTRPTYIATANTFYAPVSAVSPILAGWLAGEFGYDGLFIGLVIVGALGVILMHTKVQLPEKSGAGVSIGH